MTSNLGSLKSPRFGIALVWFLDESVRPPGEPAGPASPSTASSPPAAAPATPPVTPEDIEMVRGLTGLAPAELVARLQEIAAGYARTPGALRAELLRITGGDEIAAEHLMQLIQAAAPGRDGGDEAERAGPAEGRVIDLSRHVSSDRDTGDDDDGGNP